MTLEDINENAHLSKRPARAIAKEALAASIMIGLVGSLWVGFLRMGPDIARADEAFQQRTYGTTNKVEQTETPNTSYSKKVSESLSSVRNSLYALF